MTLNGAFIKFLGGRLFERAFSHIKIKKPYKILKVYNISSSSSSFSSSISLNEEKLRQCPHQKAQTDCRAKFHHRLCFAFAGNNRMSRINACNRRGAYFNNFERRGAFKRRGRLIEVIR